MEKKEKKELFKGENKLKHFFKTIIPAFVPSIGIYMFWNIMVNFDFEQTENVSVWPFFVSWLLFCWWYYKADSTKRMWYRTLVACAIISFIFPFAVFIGGLKASVKTTNPISGIGGFIGTGVATMFIAVFAILFGLAFSVGAYFLRKSIKD